MKGKIALFVYQPYCSVQSANGIIQALSDHYNFKIFSRQPVEDSFFNDVDCICFPGGLGDSEKWHYLLKHNSKLVKEFVNQGGHYLGICMGAYWAGSHYFDILDNIDCVQYIKRPGTDTKRPHAKALDVTWDNNRYKMFFYDGCSVIGNLSKSTVVARYNNGDAMAVIHNRIGLIGCHPESEYSWYQSYSWMTKHWHNQQQHQLLLKFTQSLLAR